LKFNVDENKYSDDDIILNLRYYSIIEMVNYLLFICIITAHYITSLVHIDKNGLIKEKKKQNEWIKIILNKSSMKNC